MRISTKGRYATRLMLDLAVHYECGYIPLKAVSQRQNISDKYLARGAQGGYQLTKSPEEYTVGDILRTTEGSLAPVSCLEAGSGVCEMERTCVTLEVWQQIEEAVNQVVDHITLADLVKRYHEKAGADYVI